MMKWGMINKCVCIYYDKDQDDKRADAMLRFRSKKGILLAI